MCIPIIIIDTISSSILSTRFFSHPCSISVCYGVAVCYVCLIVIVEIDVSRLCVNWIRSDDLFAIFVAVVVSEQYSETFIISKHLYARWCQYMIYTCIYVCISIVYIIRIFSDMPLLWMNNYRTYDSVIITKWIQY